VTICKIVFVRQFARANNGILAGDNPVSDTTNRENNSEMNKLAGERKLHQMANATVSNGSGLPGCGPGLERDQMVQSGFSPGKPWNPPGSGTGSNWTAVPFYIPTTLAQI